MSREVVGSKLGAGGCFLLLSRNLYALAEVQHGFLRFFLSCSSTLALVSPINRLLIHMLMSVAFNPRW